MQTTSSKC